MPITEPHDPLKCYCGKPTKIYDSLFSRNFCSDECSTDLRLFLGGTDRVIDINTEIQATKAGDFQIRGGVVTLHETLQSHQVAKASIIDKIDAQVAEQQAQDKQRRDLKKLGLNDAVIEAMLLAAKK